jgi:hypothetical protein
MALMNELKLGIETESEHYKTFKKLMDGKKHTMQSAAKMVALDHIKEHPQYYSKLRNTGLK